MRFRSLFGCLGLAILVFLVAVNGVFLSPARAATPVLVDNFNSNSINSTIWTVKLVGNGPSLAAVNGRIEVTLPPNSVNDPSLQVFGDGLGTVCPLGGDFDIQ